MTMVLLLLLLCAWCARVWLYQYFKFSRKDHERDARPGTMKWGDSAAALQLLCGTTQGQRRPNPFSPAADELDLAALCPEAAQFC